MAIQIREYRISFLQIETLNGLVPANAPCGFLANPDSYEQAVILAQAGQGAWQLPKHSGHFWQYYLPARKLETANPRKAVSRLLPVFIASLLRPALEAGLVPAGAAVRANCSGYAWPHCLGVMVNLNVQGAFALAEAVDLAMSLRYAPLYRPGDEAAPLNLEVLFERSFDLLRSQTLGPAGTAAGAAGEPGDLFSVVSFISGSGASVAKAPPAKGQVHKALEGLSSWNRLWRSLTLGALTQSITPAQNDNILSNVLYRSRRGRVVWQPGNFQTPDVRAVGCYHSNLSQLSLQIESQAVLVEKVAARYRDPQAAVGASLQAYAKSAAVNLSLLYGASKETYRSASARDQILDNGYLSAINELRKRLVNGPDLT
jgi:hypothetical protein